jgi:hypothetical protein
VGCTQAVLEDQGETNSKNQESGLRDQGSGRDHILTPDSCLLTPEIWLAFAGPGKPGMIAIPTDCSEGFFQSIRDDELHSFLSWLLP